jgi:hypothetical protein
MYVWLLRSRARRERRQAWAAQVRPGWPGDCTNIHESLNPKDQMRVTRRYRDQSRATGSRMGTLLVGAVLGLAVGAMLADRGGLRALRETVNATRRRRRSAERPERDTAGTSRPLYRKPPAPDMAAGDAGEALELRVLEAFRNDPILAERSVDISAIGTGIIELTGWVEAPDEVKHATTLARGTIGVSTVVNRLVQRPAAD